jgi:hypothetical protein
MSVAIAVHEERVSNANGSMSAMNIPKPPLRTVPFLASDSVSSLKLASFTGIWIPVATDEEPTLHFLPKV